MILNEDEQELTSFVMLQDSDFPEHYRNKCHPEDYISISEPISETHFHLKLHHSRLLLRHTFKLSETEFLPVTFVCDTGAPSSLYLCSRLKEILLRSGRIKIQEDTLVEYIKVDGRKLIVMDTPSCHENVNIIGLNALMFFQLQINYNFSEKTPSFSFLSIPEYF